MSLGGGIDLTFYLDTMSFDFHFQFDRLVRKELEVHERIKDIQSSQTLIYLKCFNSVDQLAFK
jgi:hypothetical protein